MPYLSLRKVLVLPLIALLSQPAFADEHGKPDPAQLARGAKAWADACSRCHNLRAPDELGDKEWEISVMHMRVRASIPAQTARDIEAFLKASN